MTQYHVTLNGQGYLVDLDRYARRPAAVFAPKRSEGAPDVGDFLVEEGLRVSDWSGGEGYLQLDPASPARWRSGTGIDGWTEPGSLRLGPHVQTTVAGPYAAENTCGAVYKGKLYYGWSDGLLVSYDGTNVTTIATTGKAGGIRALQVAFGKLYVGNGTDGKVDEWDGTTYTTAKFDVASSSLGVRAMGMHYRQAAQFLYVGSDRATNGRVYFWDGATLSAAQFEFEQPRPEAMAVFNRRLYFAVSDSQSRRGALYSVDDAGSGGNYAHHEVFSQHYPTSLAVYDGKLWLGTGGSPDGLIYSYDGSSLHVEKRLGSIYAPYTLDIRAIWPHSGALWAGIFDGSVTLLRYDGVGWSRPATGLLGLNAVWLGGYAGDLYIGNADTAGSARLARTRPSYRATGTQESGLFDAGLPSIDKVWRSVTLTHAALPASATIEVQYQLDGAGSWTSLGTSDVDNATSKVLSFSGTVTSKQIAFRVLLGGSADAATSPVLYDFLLRYVPAPPLKREWELPIVLEGTAELPQVTLDGQPNPRTGAQMSADLWTAKAAAGPITFVDLDGASRPAYFTNLEEKVAPLTQRKGYQTIGLARLVEA